VTTPDGRMLRQDRYISGGSDQLFMPTNTSDPSAATIAVSGFSMIRSSMPASSIWTTEKFATRSGSMFPRRTSASRSNAATPAAPSSRSARSVCTG